MTRENYYDIEEIRKVDNSYRPFGIEYKINDLEKLNNNIKEEIHIFVDLNEIQLRYYKSDEKRERAQTLDTYEKRLGISPKESFELLQDIGQKRINKNLIDRIEKQPKEERHGMGGP